RCFRHQTDKRTKHSGRGIRGKTGHATYREAIASQPYRGRPSTRENQSGQPQRYLQSPGAIKSSGSLLCFYKPFCSLLKEIRFPPTDHHSITNTAASNFFRSCTAFVQDLVNLKDQAVFPTDKPRMTYSFFVNIQVDRDIRLSAMCVRHSLPPCALKVTQNRA